MSTYVSQFCLKQSVFHCISVIFWISGIYEYTGPNNVTAMGKPTLLEKLMPERSLMLFSMQSCINHGLSFHLWFTSVMTSTFKIQLEHINE